MSDYGHWGSSWVWEYLTTCYHFFYYGYFLIAGSKYGLIPLNKSKHEIDLCCVKTNCELKVLKTNGTCAVVVRGNTSRENSNKLNRQNRLMDRRLRRMARLEETSEWCEKDINQDKYEDNGNCYCGDNRLENNCNASNGCKTTITKKTDGRINVDSVNIHLHAYPSPQIHDLAVCLLRNWY